MTEIDEFDLYDLLDSIAVTENAAWKAYGEAILAHNTLGTDATNDEHAAAMVAAAAARGMWRMASELLTMTRHHVTDVLNGSAYTVEGS